MTVEEWIQDKNPHPIIATFAPMVAAFSLELPNILQHQKKHRLLHHSFP